MSSLNLDLCFSHNASISFIISSSVMFCASLHCLINASTFFSIAEVVIQQLQAPALTLFETCI